MKTKQKNSKFIRHILLPMLFLFAIAAAASCGGGGNGGASSDGGGNSGGGGSTTSGVGPGGGTVAGPYGAQVIVPAGALASTVDIVIARESANAPDFPPNGIAAVGATYEITPHGTPFAQPVTVRVPFDTTQVPTGTTPTLYKAEPDGVFSEIATTVDGNMLVAQVTDFSNFISAAGYPYLEFAYSTGANAGIGTIYGYSIDAAAGALTPTTQGTYANGNAVMNAAIDRDGRYYYAVSPILGAPIGSPRAALKQYSIESDGGLTSLGQFSLPVDASSNAAIVIGPTGTYAYMVNGSADILQYSIGADGTLTPLNTPRVSIPGGGEFRDIVVAPSGKYAYTVAWDYTTGNPVVGQYAVGTDGALTAMSTPSAAIATGTTPQRIVVDPSGRYAYVLNSDSVSQYIIGRVGILGTPGMLMLMTPATIATGPLPTDIIVHPSGKYVYVTNAGDTTLSQYKIGASIGAYGALASLSPATVPAVLAGSYGMWISVDPSGQYAYVGKWDNTNVLRYRIGQGALTALGTATTINVMPGRMLFAKKPITPAGPNTGIVSSSPGAVFGTSSGSTPSGGTSSGAGPFNLSVGFGAWGGWITGGGGGGGDGGGSNPTLASIAVTPANPSIAVGATQQFTATGTYSDSSTQNITASVTWSPSDATKATINTSGLATAVAAGSTTITATSGNISGNTLLVVGSSVNLPKTGQTLCYDAAGTAITCANTGQDGDLQKGVTWPNPRFTVDGTGLCITDNLTGLMWVRTPDSTTRTWAIALTYADGLSLCGYTDWRLPNVNELESLINAGETNTATWLNAQGFSNVQANYYWSSTTYASSTTLGWAVMWDGYVAADVETATLYVWPVRAGQ